MKKRAKRVKEIWIIVNGLKEKVPENSTVSFLISHFGEDFTHPIVEHNGQFVYSQQYPTTVVSEGDRIELINPLSGG